MCGLSLIAEFCGKSDKHLIILETLLCRDLKAQRVDRDLLDYLENLQVSRLIDRICQFMTKSITSTWKLCSFQKVLK